MINDEFYSNQEEIGTDPIAEYIKGLMTLISVISAAMTIALRDFILNFFCGIYIKFKKPFKVEDRIQIGDIKGDVMSTSTFSFEILEVSTKEDNELVSGYGIKFKETDTEVNYGKVTGFFTFRGDIFYRAKGVAAKEVKSGISFVEFIVTKTSFI